MFTFVRVQLHDSPFDYYADFHEAMAKQGFSKEVTTLDGKKQKLPWGTYVIENQSAAQALRLAQFAADETKHPARFLSMQCADVVVANLAPADPGPIELLALLRSART